MNELELVEQMRLSRGCVFDGRVWRCQCGALLQLTDVVRCEKCEAAVITVLVDDREKTPLRFSGDVYSERAHLVAGDYSLRGATADVAIERKRLDELATCCGKDRERFMAQIERLRDYELRALVVETDLSHITWGHYRSRIRPASILGTLIAIAHDMGVPVWLAGDAANASQLVERMLVRFARRERAA